MKEIINCMSYDTETATLIASDRYWDGRNMERSGRNTYLYKTQRGRYFSHHTTFWMGERDHIQALTVEEAKDLYESLPEHKADYETAFDVKPEVA
jgi:hypothetical protein